MHKGSHMCVNGLNGRASQHPTKELDGVASHIHGDAATGAGDIPKMSRVGTIMFLGLLDLGVGLVFILSPSVKAFFRHQREVAEKMF